MGRWTISIEFEPRDIWIGIFWDWEKYNYIAPAWNILHIYVCIIPCFPIHMCKAYKINQ